MHALLARIPFIRRPFYQRDVARHERDRALLERDCAVKELEALKSRRQDTAVSSEPGHPVNEASATPPSSPQRFCVFCRNQVDAWLPYHINRSNLSDFLLRVGTVGSNSERFRCPHCSSNDRERHLLLFLQRLGIMEPMRGGAVLHMAPELRLQEFMRSHDFRLYVKGDLAPSDESIRAIDLERIPFPDESFDLVICNHVLEHVGDVGAALSEMRRVLKPGGRAICQTPFARRLTSTLEDPLHQSEGDRLFFYGQEDHLRLFGVDIEQIFRRAGFTGRLVPHEEILPEVDPERLGLNEHEPFFDFVRSPTTEAD